MIYECEPGEHLFWVSSEIRDFMPATLEPNQVYIVDAMLKLGGFKARVDLIPVLENDEKLMKKVKKLLTKKAPVEMDENELKSQGQEMSEYIEVSLDMYEKQTDRDKVFDVLSPEMANGDF